LWRWSLLAIFQFPFRQARDRFRAWCGTGSEVMQRIAVPMIGGMILTLVIIPAV
jgi:hypothetical protein